MKNFILIGEDLKCYQHSTVNQRKILFQRLLQQSYRYTSEDIPLHHPEKSTTYMGMAIINLSLSYLLTKEKGYLEESIRWMEGVCNYDKWGNAHLVDVDLSASWILIGLSLGYDWLYDDLPENLREKISNKLFLQAEKMVDYREKFYGKSWTTEYWQNHNWINHASLYVVGLALKKNRKLLKAQKWINIAKENFENVFSGLPEDGSDYEGAVYWRYGVFWLFVYAKIAHVEGDSNYFKPGEFLDNTFFYRLYQSNGDLSQQVGFGDCHDRYSSHSVAMYYLMAQEFKNSYAQFLGNLVFDKFLYEEAYNSKIKPGILPEAAFEFLFYDPNLPEKNISELPLIRNFADLGLAYVRSSWSKDALIYSTKCSAPGGHKQWNEIHELRQRGIDAFGLGHHHPDNNSFVLISNNEFFAIDEGYNRASSAAYHNMVLVDNLGYENEGKKDIYSGYSKDMIGTQKVFREEEKTVIIVGETSGTYAKKLKMNKVQRTSIFQKGPQPFVLIVDVLSSELKHQYSWQLQTDWFPETVSLLQNEIIANYKINQTKFLVHQWSSNNLNYNLSKEIHKEIMTTQEPNNYRQISLKKLKTTTEDSTFKNLFLTLVVPTTEEYKSSSILKGVVVENNSLSINCEINSGIFEYQIDLRTGDFRK